MNSPKITYRIQLRKEFDFTQLNEIIPYLTDLGICTIYASPILKSREGSAHGYDGVNPDELDPEIGSPDQLASLLERLKAHNLKWLQDIVPNHQAFSIQNPWLLDVLEKGRRSEYAPVFDIDWEHPLCGGKLLWPILDRPLEGIYQQKGVQVLYDHQRLFFDYSGNLFPLGPSGYQLFFKDPIFASNQAFRLISQQLDDLERVEDLKRYALQWDEIRMQIYALSQQEWEQQLIADRLKAMNEGGFVPELMEVQAYTLVPWWKTNSQINYRRFFTVNDLICLNMQDPEVFAKYHQKIAKLLQEEQVIGLRIDHIDGLLDPTAYLHRLRELMGEEKYLVVEKILESDEGLPENWPVQGTTGYDFLATVNNLLTDPQQADTFTLFYERFVGSAEKPEVLLLQKKRLILKEHMGGEWQNLFNRLAALTDLTTKKGMVESVKEALAEFLVRCPVYRYYGRQFPLSQQESCKVHELLDAVRGSNPAITEAVQVLEIVLLVSPLDADAAYRRRVADFYSRCMQLAGPLMAKGVEDTLMYTYNRYIAHNEVGDSVCNFGISSDAFHQKMMDRQAYYPGSMSATATHDTKRGEDVRARLNVLGDVPAEWFGLVERLHRSIVEGREPGIGPDANDEYFIYQTLVGSYPMGTEVADDYPDRLKAYFKKAFREAKRFTHWEKPNAEYEQGVDDFVSLLLDKEGPYYKLLIPFKEKIEDFGILNSLVQLTLKFTCPGVPDIYQGTELWDLSLVDPDNRRPVDYELRNQMLESHSQSDIRIESLWSGRHSGEIKLWLMQQLLQVRKDYHRIFEEGTYVPLAVDGPYAQHILAYAREFKNRYIVVVVPLHLAQQPDSLACLPAGFDWKDTYVRWPDTAMVQWQHLLQGSECQLDGGFYVRDIFKGFPLAILKGEKQEKRRNAGILLHLTSLAAPFGIGDMGPEAYGFIDFLSKGNQAVWQMLPLNPTAASEHHSPYSTLSSQAGNPLLISPALLYREGLLEYVNLKEFYLPQSGKVDFTAVEAVKGELLRQAYASFLKKASASRWQDFKDFCSKNEGWLNDYALFMVIRQLESERPWYEWSDKYKNYNLGGWKDIHIEQEDALQYQKWVQYIFDRQWKALQRYAHGKQVQLLGDIPFYVSYNSVDVWAHTSLFKLDADGQIASIAGVPPDAFSDQGQLWGMPVFDWEKMQENQYEWWIQRLRKNKEYFDTLRIDHFRAFIDFWEVPGGSSTARTGTWSQGPGAAFFERVKADLNDLPFVAEDLGASNPEVDRVRDLFGLPGMKVLQFAFDANFAQNPHIPHQYTNNFIAYTGTHDNNTTKGWFEEDIDEATRKRIGAYIGQDVTSENIVDLFVRLVYASVAQTAILPLQDVLALGAEAMMNRPGSTQDNWTWRLSPGQLGLVEENRLRLWTKLYNRG